MNRFFYKIIFLPDFSDFPTFSTLFLVYRDPDGDRRSITNELKIRNMGVYPVCMSLFKQTPQLYCTTYFTPYISNHKC